MKEIELQSKYTLRSPGLKEQHQTLKMQWHDIRQYSDSDIAHLKAQRLDTIDARRRNHQSMRN